MTRSNAREIACHLVYEMNFGHLTAGEVLQSLLDESYYPSLQTETDIYVEKPSGRQLEYLKEVVCGVQAEQETLDGYISKFSVGWNLDRISRVARAVMLVCMYECLHVEDVPVSAAINEAVELTRKYEDEDVVSFVNGILGAFAREVCEQ